MTGVSLRVVPYRSGAATVNDVVAGHVTFMFDQLSGGFAADVSQRHASSFCGDGKGAAVIRS